jgi:hypothetical protein
LILAGFIFSSCKSEINSPEDTRGEIIFSHLGLVDSAVVYGCYSQTIRYFVDTLKISSFSRLRVEFDGYANSDGSYIKVLYNTGSTFSEEIYFAEDIAGVNKFHSFEFAKPGDSITMELRIYINPPVCGEGEFKYTRARDLNIYGIK